MMWARRESILFDCKRATGTFAIIRSIPIFNSRKENNQHKVGCFLLVGEEGIEPSRTCVHRILSPARLPIPPPAQVVHTIKMIVNGRLNRVIVLYL